ncbi:protein of unknown function [Rhizobiales bacterium GAS188]|nr:protein of unknown function [Rhizobiales bacterium GAS188]
MRPGSNKRMRGRNRRGPNPLARSYESNGPDVKVRGTAQHIADRYLQLARDAQSSGDPVTAESYFQYAEHYLRIIAAAQEQMQAQYGYRAPENGADEDGEGEEGDVEGFAAPHAGAPQNGGFNGQPRQAPRAPIVNGPPDGDDPQPPMFSSPRERFDNRNQRPDRDNWNRQNRNDGNRYDNRQNNNRPDSNRHDNPRRETYRRDAGSEGAPSEFSGESRQQPRGGYGEGGQERQQGFEQRRFQGQSGGEGREERPQRERFERAPRPAPHPAPQEEQVLPSFITAPVRQPTPVSEATPVEPIEAKEPSSVELAPPAAESPAIAPRRRGRPRRVVEPSPDAAESAAAPADDESPVGAK